MVRKAAIGNNLSFALDWDRWVYVKGVVCCFSFFRLVACTIAKETLLLNFGHCSVVKLFFKSQAALRHHLYSYVLQSHVANTTDTFSPLHAHPKVRRPAANLPLRGIAVRVGAEK